MPNFKVKKEELRILAEKYNEEGRQAICEILQSKYEVKTPNTVIKRMQNVECFHYDAALDQFLFHQTTSPDKVFLSMDELCTPIVQVRADSNDTPHNNKPQAMQNLIQELIGDRLLEISKYVVMDPLSKKVIIEKTLLITDGYQVILN